MKKEFLNFTGASWGEFSNASGRGQARIPDVVSEDVQGLYDYIYAEFLEMGFSNEETLEYLSPFFGGGNYTTPTSSPTSWVGTTDCDDPTFCVASDIQDWQTEYFEEVVLTTTTTPSFSTLPAPSLFAKSLIEAYGCNDLLQSPIVNRAIAHTMLVSGLGASLGVNTLSSGYITQQNAINLYQQGLNSNLVTASGGNSLIENFLASVEDYIVNNCADFTGTVLEGISSPEEFAEVFDIYFIAEYLYNNGDCNGNVSPNNPNLNALVMGLKNEAYSVGGQEYLYAVINYQPNLNELSHILTLYCQGIPHEGNDAFGTPPAIGCTDPEAINYDPNATIDGGGCDYPSYDGEPVDEPISDPLLPDYNDYYDVSNCLGYLEAYEYLLANPTITMQNAEGFAEAVFILLGKPQNPNYGDVQVEVDDDMIVDEGEGYSVETYEGGNGYAYYEPQQNCKSFMDGICQGNILAYSADLPAPDPIEPFYVQQEVANTLASAILSLNQFVLDVANGVIDATEFGAPADYDPIEIFGFAEELFERVAELEMDCNNLQLVPVVVEQAVGQMLEDYLTFAYTNGYFEDELYSEYSLEDVVCMDEYFHNDSFFFIFELLNYTPSICGGVDGCPECPECPECPDCGLSENCPDCDCPDPCPQGGGLTGGVISEPTQFVCSDGRPPKMLPDGKLICADNRPPKPVKPKFSSKTPKTRTPRLRNKGKSSFNGRRR